MRSKRRHDEAVIQAEVRRLAAALRPYRILRREALERAAHADRWSRQGFEQALAEGVKRGAIEQLPLGFYREAGDDDVTGGA